MTLRKLLAVSMTSAALEEVSSGSIDRRNLARTEASEETEATHMLKKIAQGMLTVGLLGLVLSFRALGREREGAAFFLVAGVALLIVGAIVLFIASRPTSHTPVEYGDLPSRAPTTESPGPRELAGGWLGYAAVALSIAFALAFTVYVIVQGIDGSILFLIWIVFGGFAVIFLARKQGERSARRNNAE